MAPRWLAWLVLGAADCVWLAQQRLQQLNDSFDTDARIAHRVLSQRMVQHEAILATLVLLQPESRATEPGPLERPSPAPTHRCAALRHDHGAPAWPAGWPPGMDAALPGNPAPAATPCWFGAISDRWPALPGAGREHQPALPCAWICASRPWRDDWPLSPGSPGARLPRARWSTLHHPGRRGKRCTLAVAGAKTLAATSQPCAAHAAGGAGGHAAVGQHAGLVGRQRRHSRRCASCCASAWRASARRAAAAAGARWRLNTLASLLPAWCTSSTSHSRRCLPAARPRSVCWPRTRPTCRCCARPWRRWGADAALASDVVTIAAPGRAPRRSHAGAAPSTRPGVIDALHLPEPQLSAWVQICSQFALGLPAARADAVALQQILHNLLTNALQAMDTTPVGERQLWITLTHQGAQLLLTVRATAAALPPDMRPRLFTPFATGRDKRPGPGPDTFPKPG